MSELTYVSTGRPEFDQFYPRIRSFLQQDTMDMTIDGERIRGYRSPDTPAVWLRDYSDMMRGFRFFERDLVSTITHFADTQARNGRIFDYFTTQPEKLPCERENWSKYVRVPVEADVEYRFVKAAYLAWQATGDDAWARSMVDPMERALRYVFSSPQRWDAESGLVKRAYTIDSWDFAYSAGKHDWLQFQINDDTFWGIMHGDNSGYYEACRLLASMQRCFGMNTAADGWDVFAGKLKERLNAVCWNGRFYTHFVKLSLVTIDGLAESEQLSFSNPMNINRGVATNEQAVSILEEYQKRREANDAFAEWFSIDPPFPDGIFGDDKIVGGAYCNGGIMPLVGGELCRAYLEHGFESCGVETLRQYYAMIEEKGETYLWYFPDGTSSSVDTSTSPDATPTDGWGSSAMLYAFMEGLVGIQDRSKLLLETRISPRWAAAGVNEAVASLGYEASGASLGYSYTEHSDRVKMMIEAHQSQAAMHILLPEGAEVKKVVCGGDAHTFAQSRIRGSRYVDFDIAINGGADLELLFK